MAKIPYIQLHGIDHSQDGILRNRLHCSRTAKSEPTYIDAADWFRKVVRDAARGRELAKQDPEAIEESP